MSNFSKDIDDFYKIKDSTFIIDVRSENEYKMLPRLKNSVNIPIDCLTTEEGLKMIKNQIKPNQIIITVCNAGNRSGQAADFLRTNGFENAFVLNHGIYGYKSKYHDIIND